MPHRFVGAARGSPHATPSPLRRRTQEPVPPRRERRDALLRPQKRPRCRPCWALAHLREEQPARRRRDVSSKATVFGARPADGGDPSEWALSGPGRAQKSRPGGGSGDARTGFSGARIAQPAGAAARFRCDWPDGKVVRGAAGADRARERVRHVVRARGEGRLGARAQVEAAQFLKAVSWAAQGPCLGTRHPLLLAAPRTVTPAVRKTLTVSIADPTFAASARDAAGGESVETRADERKGACMGESAAPRPAAGGAGRVVEARPAALYSGTRKVTVHRKRNKLCSASAAKARSASPARSRRRLGADPVPQSKHARRRTSAARAFVKPGKTPVADGYKVTPTRPTRRIPVAVPAHCPSASRRSVRAALRLRGGEYPAPYCAMSTVAVRRPDQAARVQLTPF